MIRQKSPQQIDRGTWLRYRLAWAAMLVSHVFWFARGLTRPDPSLLSLGALALAIVFIGLKTFDLFDLEFAVTRKSLVATIMIVVLLHTGAIERSMDVDGVNPGWLLAVLTVGVVCPRPKCRAIIRHFYQLLAAFGCMLTVTVQSCARRVSDYLVRHHQVHFAAVTAPRAPPR